MSHKRPADREDDQTQGAGAGGNDGGKRSRRPQKHLYLVLDDRDTGFSIHKINADTFLLHSDEDYHHHRHHHLPDPPILQLESPPGRVPHNGTFFSALLGKIFILTSQRRALVYDAATGELSSAGPRAPAHMLCGFGVTVPVGDTLYALSCGRDHCFSLDAMSPADGTSTWNWKALPPPPPELRQRVCASALHPDGRTIFVTSHPGGTFSFDTRSGRWRWHGGWALPFLGRAHYDAGLDAWVGLGAGDYICACQVASPTCHYTTTTPTLPATTTPLDCRMTREKLFCEDWDTHMTASLTSMGGDGRFCLVQCDAREPLHLERRIYGEDDGCTIRLTMFGLEYDHEGELRTTDRRSTTPLAVRRHIGHFGPVAFWV